MKKTVVLFLMLLVPYRVIMGDQHNQNRKSNSQNQKPNKLVALVQIRNEAFVIEQALRALAFYIDEIAVLDDASDDNTVAIVESLAQELPIKIIMRNDLSAWQVTSEVENRQKLLDAGRALGGTHFLLVDADEILSANCLQDDYLRKRIFNLVPGMILHMPCVNVWDGVTHYRDDKWCHPFDKYRWLKEIAFCDDGVCNYTKNVGYGGPAQTIHVHRVPLNLKYTENEESKAVVNQYVTVPYLHYAPTFETGKRVVDNNTLKYTLIHYKYANLDSLLVKKNWYMCLEFIAAQQQNFNTPLNAELINGIYDKKEFECLEAKTEDIIVRPIRPEWIAYDFIDYNRFAVLYPKQRDEIFKWFAFYGTDYFEGLHLHWSVLPGVRTQHLRIKTGVKKKYN